MNEAWEYQPIGVEEGFDRFVFDGDIRPTEQVREVFSPEEVKEFVDQVRDEVWKQIGLSSGQIFQHAESKERLVVVDNLPIRKRMVKRYIHGESHESVERENFITVTFEREHVERLLREDEGQI